MKTTMTENDTIFRKFQVEKFNNKRMVPTVTMSINVNASKLLETKKEFSKSSKKRITVTHIIIKAIANTIVDYPILYGFFDGKNVVCNSELMVNIPVEKDNHVEYIAIKNPNAKTLHEISDECFSEIEKINKDVGSFLNAVRKVNKIPSWLKNLYTKLKPAATYDFLRNHYGNFAISNFGSFNVNKGTLALSQPIIASICFGKITPTLIRENSEFETVMQLPFTISFDHRPIDGAYAGRFLYDLKKALEVPGILFQNI